MKEKEAAGDTDSVSRMRGEPIYIAKEILVRHARVYLLSRAAINWRGFRVYREEKKKKIKKRNIENEYNERNNENIYHESAKISEIENIVVIVSRFETGNTILISRFRKCLYAPLNK